MTDFVFYRITILETVVCMEKGDFMYRIRLRNNLSVLQSELAALNRSGFLETKKYMQHGSTSVYRHCIAVAYISCIIAARLNIRIHIRQMIRGALLHDYFLYDWHKQEVPHRFHGFTHQKTALRNAERDFDLSERECDIISKHMFPLTLVPPMHRESWIVSMADKYCALRETFA